MVGLFALALSLPPALFDAPTLRGAQVGIYAIAADGGAEIYAHDPDAAMVPASNLKLVVGSAALDLLGPAFSFTTSLASDGGVLYLRGGGDPLLDDADMADAAAALSTASATRFVRLAGDDRAVRVPRYPDGWQQDDLPYDYAAPPGALDYGENVVHLTVRPTATGEPPALSVTPAQSTLTILNDAVTGAARSDDTVGLQIAWSAAGTVVLSGSIPSGAQPDTIDASVLDPAMFAIDQSSRALKSHGIALAGENVLAATPDTAHVLWTHHSPALPVLLRLMWQPSDNLLAESLLDAIGDGSRERGLDAERAWLHSIGVDPATTSLDDGSGLSAYDRITPRDLVTILSHDWNGSNRASVLAALPVAGKSGTLAHSFVGTPLEGAVIAKTGTVNHARALAGYLQTPHGTIIFALLVDGWMDPSPDAENHLRAFQASVLRALGGL